MPRRWKVAGGILAAGALLWPLGLFATLVIVLDRPEDMGWNVPMALILTLFYGLIPAAFMAAGAIAAFVIAGRRAKEETARNAARSDIGGWGPKS